MNDASKEADQEAPLLIETQGRLRILTLNRPERLNALTPELHHQLREAVLDASEDNGVGAVLLTGAGRGFCAGGDIKASSERARKTRESLEERAESLRQHSQTTVALCKMPKITIALINGAAAGAGLTLALACDLRVAVSSAVLRTSYAQIALAGDLGISYFLTRLVGPSKARELMLFNEKISADQAHQLGLVNRVVDLPGLTGATLEWLNQLAEGPSVAFGFMKQNLVLAETGSLEEVVEQEAINSAHCVRTRDVKEASTAFREKRSPNFEGR
jgi:2-(1,2-epoxy-1,2-dihydrophenyl)acetyl-CoA isomerase